MANYERKPGVPKGGVLERMLGKFGFVRADKIETEVEQGAEPEEMEGMAKVIALPKPAHPMPVVVGLNLTERQKLSFMAPYAPGAMPGRECFETEKLRKGYSIVTSLLVAPNDDGEYISWVATISAFMVLKKGKAPIKPKGLMKGLMINRVQNLLKGVGEASTDTTEWRRGSEQFVMGRRLTVEEEAEFKRIHGQKWLSDAVKGMQKGGVTQWDVENA